MFSMSPGANREDKFTRKLNRLLQIKKNLIQSLTLLSKQGGASHKGSGEDFFFEKQTPFSQRNLISTMDSSSCFQKQHHYQPHQYHQDWFNKGNGMRSWEFQQTLPSHQQAHYHRDAMSVLPVGHHQGGVEIQTWPKPKNAQGYDFSSSAVPNGYGQIDEADEFEPIPPVGGGGGLGSKVNYPSSGVDDKSGHVTYVPRSYWRHERHTLLARQDKSPPNFTNPNADIIRYLNQFNDKQAFSLQAPYPVRHPCSFENIPCYASTDNSSQNSMENNTAKKGLDDEWSQESSSGSRVTLQNEEIVESNNQELSSAECQWSGCQSPSSATHSDSSSLGRGGGSGGGGGRGGEGGEEGGRGQCCYVTPANLRMSSEDTGSVLSSEADSDFLFYPCTSLSQGFQTMTLADTHVIKSTSSADVATNVSWRSDFYGSSLDEITREFYLDDDALSDDVFIDEPTTIISEKISELYCESDSCDEVSPVYTKRDGVDVLSFSKSTQCDEFYEEWEEEYIEEEDGFEEREGIVNDDTTDFSQGVKNGEDTSTTYAELNDVIDQEQNGASPAIPEDRLLMSSPEVRQCRDSHSSNESHLELSCELAHTFDSLRRNSTQNKSRHLWKERRARARKVRPRHRHFDLDPQAKVEDEINSKLLSKSEDAHKSREEVIDQDRICPTKPLRGILKNKYCQSRMEKVEEKLEHLSNEDLDTGKTNMPENSPTQQPSDSGDGKLAVTAKRPQTLSISPNNTLAPTTGSGKTKQSMIMKPPLYIQAPQRMIKAEQTRGENDSSPVSEVFTSSNSPPSLPNGDNITAEDSSFGTPTAENTRRDLDCLKDKEEFHFLLSPTDEGDSEVIAVRKNSIEMYKWTHSMKRRRKLRAKKSLNRSKSQKEERTTERFALEPKELSIGTL